ncbi:hypothetical protein WNY79_20160 [Pseudoalteromonas sp. AS84]|jgi:hypothetical protein|uniref:hypothetical protein n=1 Tax=Pseudoalteromonas sp. AS84 TaxID=3135778 RepID=UPI00316EF35D
MESKVVASLNLSEIIKRQIHFLYNNDIYDSEGNEESDRGEDEALTNMLESSLQLSEKEFEAKYLAELAELKHRFDNKEYNVADGDDYYESYNNTLVSILRLINPYHGFDLSV